jgi:hypothetical protein
LGAALLERIADRSEALTPALSRGALTIDPIVAETHFRESQRDREDQKGLGLKREAPEPGPSSRCTWMGAPVTILDPAFFLAF